MGLIAYFTSRCKAHCADESRCTRWDGQKNEVITFSRDAKVKSTPLVQLSAVTCRLPLALQNKNESCCVTTQLSLFSNLKVTA